MNNPVALVTGGSAGIGRAIAESLASRGHDLTLVGRRADRLREAAEDLVAQHGVNVEPVVADLGARDAVDAILPAHRSRFGRLDVLVNNAGVTGGSRIGDISAAEVDDHMEVNLRALIILTDSCAADLLAAASERGRAHVINVASMLAVTTAPSRAVYAAMKHGMMGFTRSINAEMAGQGVYATALCPSYVATERTAPFAEVMPPDGLVQPEDLARAVELILDLSPGVYLPELMLQRPADAFGLCEDGTNR